MSEDQKPMKQHIFHHKTVRREPFFCNTSELRVRAIILHAITCVYTIDREHGVIRAGASIYTHDERQKTSWSRKIGVTMARDRWENTPVVLDFGGPITSKMGVFQYARLEKFLRHIFCVSHVTGNGSASSVSIYKDRVFGEDLTEEEQEAQQRFLEHQKLLRRLDSDTISEGSDNDTCDAAGTAECALDDSEPEEPIATRRMVEDVRDDTVTALMLLVFALLVLILANQYAWLNRVTARDDAARHIIARVCESRALIQDYSSCVLRLCDRYGFC